MNVIKYPMAVKTNTETGEINGWLPDLTVLARGKTTEEMKTQAIEYVKEYLNLAISHDAKIPTPTSSNEMQTKWTQANGYYVDFISVDIN